MWEKIGEILIEALLLFILSLVFKDWFIEKWEKLKFRINSQNLPKHIRNNYRAIASHTQLKIRFSKIDIKNLSQIKRQEIDEIIASWNGGTDGILLLGEAGTGKSGIVGLLAQKLTKQNKFVVFLKANEISENAPLRSLQEKLSLDKSLIACIHDISKFKETYLIIDQLDSVSDNNSFNEFTDLLAASTLVDNVRAVGVARTYEAKESSYLKNLEFHPIESHALSYETSKDYLQQLGVFNPSDNLIELAQNLLNLSLIAEVVSLGKDVRVISGEVDLWKLFLETIKEREGIEAFQYVIELANQKAKSNEDVFSLGTWVSRPANKLVSRKILIPLGKRKYKFFHEQFRDFLCAHALLPEYKNVSQVLGIFGSKTGFRILLWLHSFNQLDDPAVEIHFLQDILSVPYKELPFYSKVKFIDPYLTEQMEKTDESVLTALISEIHRDSDLVGYFYRNKPYYNWAKILWDYGFLSEIPEIDEDAKYLPRWLAQEYLLSIADKVPDLIIKHFNNIEGRAWYISRAVSGLLNIPIEYVEEALGKLLEIAEAQILDTLYFMNIYQIMLDFGQAGLTESAFKLFESLTTPVFDRVDQPEKNSLRRAGGAKGIGVLNKPDNNQEIEIFSELDAHRLITILEGHLIIALKQEYYSDDDPEKYKKAAYWRSAIEDSEQNHYLDYKENLLAAFRDTLDIQLKQEDEEIIELVRSYSKSDFVIFRRIAIHCVREYPKTYQKELPQILIDLDNLDSTDLHHEIFLLLRDGFSELRESDRIELLDLILGGPPKDKLEYFNGRGLELLSEGIIEDAELWSQMQVDRWSFSRLWMVKEYLDGTVLPIYEKWHDEFGEQEHPEFLAYMSPGGFRRVLQESPLSFEELESLVPEKLKEFALTWEPDNDMRDWPNERSYAGLGVELANVIFASPEKYRKVINEICITRPGYGISFIDHFSNLENPSLALWKMIIDFSKQLLVDDERRLSGPTHHDRDWLHVRMALVRLLRKGFINKDNQIPVEIYSDVREILEILVNDPDPDLERDIPPENYVGYNDPITTAINSIRSIAISALITCAMDQYKHTNPSYTQDLGEHRMDKALARILEEKLDPIKESSRAVRSVIGERVINLMWLSEEWVRKNFDLIFPMEDTEESRWLFISAMSSYTIRKGYYHNLFDLFESKYRLLLQYYSKGMLFSERMHPVNNLAGHLLWNYLLSEDIDDGINIEDSLFLFVDFFKTMNKEDRKSGASVCWRSLDEENVEKHWGKIHRVWEWRVETAAKDNHSSQFDDEILEFLNLLRKVPDSESLEILWPLLKASVAHIKNIESRDLSWDALETYLVNQVEEKPVLAIELYTVMFEQGMPSRWVFDEKRARKIIETAARNKNSKQQARDLINFIGSKMRDDRFKDILDS